MKKNLSGFTLAEIIVCTFVLAGTILSFVVFRSNLQEQKKALLDSYKMTYFADYVENIIKAKAPPKDVLQPSFIKISGENIDYTLDENEKNSSILFFREGEKVEHFIRYIGENDVLGVLVDTYEVKLKLNDTEKTYFVTA